jgi:riboflavin kinase/FMN adenylyltransferase
MKVFRNIEDARNIKNPVVTTGSFDGVHIGHKTILNRLKMLADKYKGESVLITFDPHPRKVLYPDTIGKDLKLINTQEEKLALLRNAGLDNIIIIEFTKEFSRITSEEFVRDILHGKLRAKVVVAGFNHHFGFNQEGDYKQLWDLRKKYEFEAEEIPEQEVQHETVSSTKIRKAINDGYIMRANAYLDHYYIIMGVPVPWKWDNPEPDLSLIEISITEDTKLLPAPGVYAVSAGPDNERLKGMAIINGQSRGNVPEVLLHVPEGRDAGDKGLTLYFHKKIHGFVDLSDYPLASKRLKSARNEIDELIY